MSQAPEPKRKFKEGDRVKEINKMQQMCVSPFASSASKNVVTRIMADTRIGTVSATGISELQQDTVGFMSMCCGTVQKLLPDTNKCG